MVLGACPPLTWCAQEVAELRVGTQQLAAGDGLLVAEGAEGGVAEDRVRDLVEKGRAQGLDTSGRAG